MSYGFDELYDKVKGFDSASIAVFKCRDDADHYFGEQNILCSPYCVVKWDKENKAVQDGYLDVRARSLKAFVGIAYSMKDVVGELRFKPSKCKDGSRHLMVAFVPSA